MSVASDDESVMEILYTFGVEHNAAKDENREPHMITLRQSEFDRLMAWFEPIAYKVPYLESPKAMRIYTVPIQVIPDEPS